MAVLLSDVIDKSLRPVPCQQPRERQPLILDDVPSSKSTGASRERQLVPVRAPNPAEVEIFSALLLDARILFMLCSKAGLLAQSGDNREIECAKVRTYAARVKDRVASSDSIFGEAP